MSPLGLLLVCLAGALCGAASVWAFQRFAEKARILRAINRITAHLLELRLFIDEPSIVLRAEWQLIVANGAFLWALMRPALIIVPVMLLIMAGFEMRFEHGPLLAGQSAVVTAKCPCSTPPLRNVRIEAGPAFFPSRNEMMWRVRPVSNIHLEHVTTDAPPAEIFGHGWLWWFTVSSCLGLVAAAVPRSQSRPRAAAAETK